MAIARPIARGADPFTSLPSSAAAAYTTNTRTKVMTNSIKKPSNVAKTISYLLCRFLTKRCFLTVKPILYNSSIKIRPCPAFKPNPNFVIPGIASWSSPSCVSGVCIA